MTTVQDVFLFLDKMAPFSLQESWDNSGFLVGHEAQEVTSLLVALDITEDTVQEAADCGAELIVSHHPVIFHPAKTLTDRLLDGDGKILLSLVEHHMAAICCHTNLDSVEGGVNNALAKALHLVRVEQLKQTGVDCYDRPYGIGRTGELPEPMPLDSFLALVKDALHPNGVRYVAGSRMVRRVAVGGGACGSMMEDAVRAGCDTFVTSDLKYNDFLSAAALKLNLIDAGHFPTEHPVTEVLARWLERAFPAVKITKSAAKREVISYA
ncbi:MAG: Nif3-like dinuclear metal center hexameric protein [Clostridiales bacterium]|nr:Nif3-like dinuclear metal center hexameric protein [Clostridiales bacterium]